MARKELVRWSVLGIICLTAAALCQEMPNKEFISFEVAKPIMAAFSDSLPAELRPASGLDASKWSAWVQKADREVRDRLGTDIFIYYDAFERSLARANIAAMLRPGGYLLSNDKFPDNVPSGLASALDTTLVVARDPDRTDTMFCYQKSK